LREKVKKSRPRKTVFTEDASSRVSILKASIKIEKVVTCQWPSENTKSKDIRTSMEIMLVLR